MDSRAYLEHLTETDVAVLVEVSHTETVAGLHTFLDEDNLRLRDLLASDALYDELFGSGQHEAFLRASPFLIFAVLISRAHADLGETSFVEEWVSPLRRVPCGRSRNLQSSDHEFYIGAAARPASRFVKSTRRSSGRLRVSDTINPGEEALAIRRGTHGTSSLAFPRLVDQSAGQGVRIELEDGQTGG